MTIDGLERRDKFAPSQTPYAIGLGSFRKTSIWGGRVDAIWAGRKGGLTTASVGTLCAYAYVGQAVESVEDLIKYIDMRYGGTSHGKWDGETLITPTSVNEAERSRLIAILAPALEAFPAVPEGYDGWYYNRRRK